MKKKKQVFDKDIKMPNLYREDLENIELVMKNDLKSSEYRLESESYEYAGISEIKKDIKHTNQFKIQSYSPDIFVDLAKNKAFIHADDDSVNTMGSIQKIMNIIQKRERKMLYHFCNSGMLFAFAMILLSVLSLAGGMVLVNKIYAISILTFSICWIMIALYTTEYQFSRINFIYKEDKTNFFIRNKDQIGINIIVSIISFILGWLLKVS